MADTKITSLQPPQVTTNPATDVLPIVNIADPLMATSGSTRKITVNQLLGAGGTATLASATITGDLTVRTNKLKVDSTGVAIGAATAGYPLDVTGTSRFIGDAYLYSTSGGAAVSRSLIFGSAANISAASIYGQTATSNSGILYFATQTGGVMTDRLSIDSSGVFTFQNVGGAGTAMTLNATGLGVGVSPNRNLDIRQDQSAATIARVQNQSVNAAAYSELNLAASGNNWGIRNGSTAANSNRLEFVVDPTGTNLSVMQLDTSGNVLVGTASAGGSASNATKTIGGLFSTVNGSTASTASGAAVTMFTSPAEATFMVSAYIFGTGAPASYNAVAIVKVSGSTAAITTISSATGLTISLSGLNVQVTQTSGSAQVMVYSAIRIS